MKEFFEYIAYRKFVFVFSIMPFRFLYAFSDVFSLLLQYVFQYRAKVVKTNLVLSFPQKNKKELSKLNRKFYVSLGDMLVEAIKSYSASSNNMRKRFEIENIEILDEYFYKKQSCVFMMAHYANWEWISFVAEYLKHDLCTIYKPLRNKKIDKHIREKRKKHGMLLYSQQQTGFMIKNNINNPSIFTYVSDQNPATSEIEDEYWVDFLNRETAVISGAETIARKFDLPVFYLNFEKIRRGYYKINISLLELNSSTSKKGEITKKYIKKLESIIVEKPEYWLWSHKRWKRSRN